MSNTVAIELDNTPKRREILSPDINVLGLPLFLFSVIASSYAAFLLLQGSVGPEAPFPFVAFLLHVLGSLMTGLGVYVALGKYEESRTGWGLFTGLFAFLAGPVGVLGGILAYLLARGQPRQTPLTEVVKAEMFVTAVDEVPDEELIPLELQIQEQAQVEPIVDMLPLADIPTAIAIVNRLRERGAKSDIQMIREVSADPRPEVYQYALSILDKMEKKFAGEVFSLAQEIKESPNDPQLRVQMAQLHIDYIESGLLDESLTDYYWELTLSHLFEAMLSYPNNAELGSDFAQLLAKQNLVQHAGAVARQVLKKEPSLLQAQLLVLHSLYEQALDGEVEALQEARKTALENSWAVHVPRKRTSAHGPVFDLSHFWFGGNESA